VEWARFVQEQAPEWQARATSANARATAARSYFDGRLSLSEALPAYHGVPLDSPAWLQGRLDALDAAGARRAGERAAMRPGLAAPWQEAQRLQRLNVALDAEDTADALDRRLAIALWQLVNTHPALRRDALAPLRADLQGRIDSDDAVNAAAPDSPEAEAARADAVLAAEEIRRLDALLTGIRHAATARAEFPSPDEDIARLRDPATSEMAEERLKLLRPFLDEAAVAASDEALRQLAVEEVLPAMKVELDAARAALAAMKAAGIEASSLPPVESLEAQSAALGARIEVARESAASAAAATSPMEDVRRLSAALALEQLLVQQEVTSLKLETARDTGRLAQEKAEETRQEAERARDAGDDPRSKALTSMLELLAGAQDLTGEVTKAQTQLRNKQSAQLAQLRDALGEIEGKVAAAKALTNPLEARPRQNGLDEAYRDLRRHLDSLRAEARDADAMSKSANLAADEQLTQRAEDADRLEDLLKILGDGPIGEGQRAPDEIRAEWDEELDAQVALAQDSASEARVYRDEVVHLLQESRTLRRELKAEVSSTELDTDRARLLRDIQLELELLGPNIATQAQDRIAWLRQLPSRLLDLRWIRGFFFGSVWLLIVGAAWSWARRRSREVVHWGLDRWAARAETPYRRSELTAIENPGVAVVIAAIDLGLGYALYNPVRESFAELGLVLLVYLQFATYRLVMNLFELTVAKHPSIRPALITLTEQPRDHAHRTVKALALWGVARQFIDFLTLQVLETDAINDVLMLMFSWLLLIISCWLLHLWEPDIRQALSRRPASNKVTAYLVEPPTYGVERIPRALVGGALLLSEVTWNLVDVRATDRSGLGRLINWVNRRRLRRDGVVETSPPIPARLWHQLTVDDCPDEWFVERPAVDEAFADALDGWIRERRAGRVVVIGDHGDGKGCWLDRRCAGLGAVGWPVIRARVDKRITTEEELAIWIAGLLELSLPEDVVEPIDWLITALMDAPGKVWVLEGLEMAFLRTVGGFQAVRALFQVIQQCSEHHFWVLSVHSPAWRYLSRLPALFDTRFFRAEITLEPLREAQLRELIDRRMASVDVVVSFDDLERGGVKGGGDPKIERERAERTYYRMLSEASQGNAAVALELWANSLTPSKTPGEVSACLPDSGTALTGLSDVDLFVLTATRIQWELDEEEMSSIINLGPAQIRAAVRSLMDRGLLIPGGGSRVGIPTLKLPDITRLLQRRHFLQR